MGREKKKKPTIPFDLFRPISSLSTTPSAHLICLLALARVAVGLEGRRRSTGVEWGCGSVVVVVLDVADADADAEGRVEGGGGIFLGGLGGVFFRECGWVGEVFGLGGGWMAGFYCE